MSGGILSKCYEGQSGVSVMMVGGNKHSKHAFDNSIKTLCEAVGLRVVRRCQLMLCSAGVQEVLDNLGYEIAAPVRSCRGVLW